MIYLASPYSHPRRGTMLKRFRDVCKLAARLMQQGHHIFSPIAHTHPIAAMGNLPKSWQFWKAYDTTMIAACHFLWVATFPGWRESVGVQAEINLAILMKKPVRFVNPRTLAITKKAE